MEMPEHPRLDPYGLEIDDLKQNVLRLNHLTGHDPAVADDAGYRRDQGLRLGAGLPDDLAAFLQPVELDLGVGELAFRGDATLHQLPDSPQLALRQCDLLLDVAALLRQGRPIGRR